MKLRMRPTLGFSCASLVTASALMLSCVERSTGPVAPVPQSPHAAVGAYQPYQCGKLLSSDHTLVEATLEKAYVAWRRLYVTGEGASGALRIRRPEDQNDSVSEGIAYGMMIAVHHGDQPIFDGLFAYARKHFDANGLMHWKISAEGRVRGVGGASDADEDMAIALIMAERLWGGGRYGKHARRMIDAIWNSEIEPGTWVLKPGDVWGGSAVLNPSYLDPAYYKIFAAYTGDKRWLDVVERSYKLFDKMTSHNGGTGLAPDWMSAGGGPAKGQSYDYKWDAARVPQRLARDAAWFCDPRAIEILSRLNQFFSTKGVLSIGDGYKLDGEKFSSVHQAAFVGPLAASAMFSDNAKYREDIWKELVKLWGGGYYSNHLRHLTLLFVTGLSPNPLEFAQSTSAPANSREAVPEAAPESSPSGAAKSPKTPAPPARSPSSAEGAAPLGASGGNSPNPGSVPSP